MVPGTAKPLSSSESVSPDGPRTQVRIDYSSEDRNWRWLKEGVCAQVRGERSGTQFTRRMGRPFPNLQRGCQRPVAVSWCLRSCRVSLLSSWRVHFLPWKDFKALFLDLNKNRNIMGQNAESVCNFETKPKTSKKLHTCVNCCGLVAGPAG